MSLALCLLCAVLGFFAGYVFAQRERQLWWDQYWRVVGSFAQGAWSVPLPGQLNASWWQAIPAFAAVFGAVARGSLALMQG